MTRVKFVEPVEGFVVRLGFTDGVVRELDLSQFLRGPIFEEIREDPKMFNKLEVDTELGTIVWPNGADIDPDVLYERATSARDIGR